jgi:regulator of sirC expression with transglutaminase-like and TPR domain
MQKLWCGQSNRFLRIFLLAALGLSVPGLSGATARPDIVGSIRAITDTPDDRIDFAREKLRLDKLIEPSTDVEAGVRQIDAMAQTIRVMAGPSAPPRLRLIMLRRYIYEAGPWNGGKPFQYDLSDPLGRKPANRLLSTYLATHRGNCVSMPVLFTALANRLGLNATLSTAPDHMFVKYTDDVTGKVFNLETTSGAYPARDVWYRQNLPMTDQAIANGLYMKMLSRKEALAVLATTVIDHAFRGRHYQEAWDIAEAIRPYYPNNIGVLLAPANAAMGLVQTELRAGYPARSDIPPALLGRLDFLEKTVSASLNHAYALGWRENDGELPKLASTAAQ